MADLFADWIAALEARHLADLRVPEVTRALRALSSAYVQRRHTIARGMAQDATGERVQVEAEGSTPLQLALALMKALREVPSLARSFTKGLLPGRRK